MPDLMTIAALIGGFLAAGLGGELFVRGCVGAASAMRIPNAIVAVTIAAFATSSPELSVAINAALAGTPEIAMGDGFGSNIVNVALVLGLVLCFGGLQASRKAILRDWLLAVATPVLILFLSWDGILSQTDSHILFGVFALWFIVVLFAANHERKKQKDEPLPPAARPWLSPLFLLSGLAVLICAGMLIVTGAKGIGAWLGLSPFITGVTLVALGTSMPELATSVIARIRGHHDIGLATVLGSNIFNLLVIVATAAALHPITVNRQEVAISGLVGVAALAFVYPSAKDIIPRWRALPLLAIYAAYVAFLIYQNA